jgi:hypothetical protein
MPRLERLEFLGGPMDGKVVAVPPAVDCYHYCLNPMVIHLYIRDDHPSGLGFRQVFRHIELILSKSISKKD